MADPYDRRKGVQGTESPYLQAQRAIKKGFQVSPDTCTAFLREIQAVNGMSGPMLMRGCCTLLSMPLTTGTPHMSTPVLHVDAARHRNVDLLVLAMMHSQGDKSALSILRRKVTQALMNEAFITRVIQGHQVGGSTCTMLGECCHADAETHGCWVQEELSDLFPSFLAMAGALIASPAVTVQGTGGCLYVELFAAFDSGYVRQVGSLVPVAAFSMKQCPP